MTVFTKTGGAQSPRVAGAASQYTSHNAYLALTDGTTTVTFMDGAGGSTNYPLHRQTWAPQIAPLRRSPLGGRSPYEDVVEELVIGVRGASASAALANLATLAALLDQAERWSRGENVAVVTLKFCPKGALVGSAANPFTAVVLGRAAGDQTAGVSLSGEWNAAAEHYFIPTVRVRLVRRGLWLHDTDTLASLGGVVPNGNIVSFISLPPGSGVASPLKLTFDNFGYGKSASTRWHGAFLLLAETDSVEPLAVINAEQGVGTAYTSVADSGRNARNTNVLRYTPTGTTEAFSADISSAVLLANTNLVAVFVNVRPHTATNFLIRARLASGTYAFQHTPLVAVPAVATQYPRWLFLGLAAVQGPTISNLYLGITADAASGTLDIDTVVLADARATQVLSIVAPGDSDADSVPSDLVGETIIDHRLGSAPAPYVRHVTRPLPYAGDAAFFSSKRVLYALLLASGGGSGTNGDEWRQANTSDVVYNNTWSLARTRAYLVPQ